MRLGRFVGEENKGMTLVELVIAIGILAIVTASIVSLWVISQRTYSKGAEEVDLQYEAQLTVNQIQDMIIDATRGVSYQYISDDGEGNVETSSLENDHGIVDPGNMKYKELYIYNSEVYYKLVWWPDTRRLYYHEFKRTGDTFTEVTDIVNGELMADYVESFSIDLSEVMESNIVRLTMVFRKNGSEREYQTEHNITLRNRIQLNNSEDEIYEGDLAVEELLPNKIIITPSNIILWPGEAVTVNATVTSSGTVVPGQGVNWSVTGQSSGTTMFDETTKQLKVGADEDAAQLSLNASCTVEEATITASPAAVKVRRISAVTIQDRLNEPAVFKGNFFQISAAVSGNNLSGLSMAEIGGISFDIIEGNDYARITSVNEEMGTAMIQVSESITGNVNFKVRATVKRAGFQDIKAEKTYEVSASQLMHIQAADGTNTWNRNAAKQLVVTGADDKLDNYLNTSKTRVKAGYSLSYHYILLDAGGDVITEFEKTSEQSETADAYIKTAQYVSGGIAQDLKYNTSVTTNVSFDDCTLSVYAILKNTANGTVVGTSETISFSIPAVQMAYGRCGDYINETSLNAYVTQNAPKVEFYYSFTSGIEGSYTPKAGDWSYVVQNAAATGDYDGISSFSVDTARNKVTFTANNNEKYYKNNPAAVSVSMKGCPNAAVITYQSGNIALDMNMAGWVWNGSEEKVPYDYFPSPVTAGYYYLDNFNRFYVYQSSGTWYLDRQIRYMGQWLTCDGTTHSGANYYTPDLRRKWAAASSTWSKL